LAALLRANHIPAGICYQRLTIEKDAPPIACTVLMLRISLNMGGIVLISKGFKSKRK